MYIYVLLILIASGIFRLYSVDPHIESAIKIAHYTSRVGFKVMGVGTDKISRWLIDKVKAIPVYTDGKFVNGFNVYHQKVKSLVDDYEIGVDIYHPETTENQTLPVILYIHGGGFVIPALMAGDIFKNKGFIYVVADYRLSPEFKHPIPLEDNFSVLKWIVTPNNLPKADLNRLYVMGDSAGGNLATCLCILNRDRKTGINIRKQVLFYPVVITRTIGQSKIDYETDGYILTGPLMRWFEKQYMRSEDDYNNPYVSPLAATDYSGIPPALFLHATEDYLYSEGVEYRTKLEKGGVEVHHENYRSAHGFMDMSEAGRLAFKVVYNFLNDNA